MNPAIVRMLDSVPDEAADETLLQLALVAMKEKLETSRAMGKNGWHTSRASTDDLMSKLVGELSEDKPDMVDVMNYAAMIHARNELYK